MGVGRPKGGRKFTAEVLAPVVAESGTFTEVCRRLGVPATGNTPTIVARYCREYGLDTSHMLGQRVSREEPTGLLGRISWSKTVLPIACNRTSYVAP